MNHRSPDQPAPLRVLLLNEFFYPDNQGGTGTLTADIARRLSQMPGVSVEAVTSRFAYRDPSMQYPMFEQWGDIPIHRVASPPWGRAKPRKRLIGNMIYTLNAGIRARFLRRFDVILVTTAPLTLPWAAKMAAFLRRTPTAYLIYDLDPDRSVALGVKTADSRSVHLVRKWQQGWLKSADRVIAIGRCMKRRLVEGYGLDPNQVAVVEVGTDPDVVRPRPKDSEFRRRHGLNGFVVLYSGNFGLYHDFDTILEAAQRLHETSPDVSFVFVGGGHKKPDIEEQVRTRNLNNVLILPFVPEEEFADLLASADLTVVTLEPGMEGLCVPSKFYSFLAAGRPVIALMPADAEVALTVSESKLGFVMPIGDVPGMIQAIETGRSCPEQLDEMGCRAREVFDRLYNSDRIAEKIHRVLLDCLGRSV